MLNCKAAICHDWAVQQREITRVYFYGSRVWGTPRRNSDLDILIVAYPGAVIGSNEEWTNELTRLLDWNAHLNDHFTADARLVQRIKSEGILVFSRHGSDLDFQFEDELEDFDPDAD